MNYVAAVWHLDSASSVLLQTNLCVAKTLQQSDLLVQDKVCRQAVSFYDHVEHDPRPQSNGFIYGRTLCFLIGMLRMLQAALSLSQQDTNE